MCLLKDELMIARLDDNISYIEPTVNPLSANVVIINGKDAVWLYDVGSHPDIPDMLYDYITKSSKLEQMSDVCIKVPQTETYMIQELHLPVYHCLCLMLEDEFFGEN